MSLHIQFNSIEQKLNKQSKQGKKRVHFAENDERSPNSLDFVPPPPKRSTIVIKPFFDFKWLSAFELW